MSLFQEYSPLNDTDMKVDQSLIEKMLQLYGQDPQLLMVVEESLELALSVVKFLRKTANAVPGKHVDKETLIKNMVEEAADVSIVLKNIPTLFGEDNVQAEIDRKVARQWKRVENFKPDAGAS